MAQITGYFRGVWRSLRGHFMRVFIHIHVAGSFSPLFLSLLRFLRIQWMLPMLPNLFLFFILLSLLLLRRLQIDWMPLCALPNRKQQQQQQWQHVVQLGTTLPPCWFLCFRRFYSSSSAACCCHICCCLFISLLLSLSQLASQLTSLLASQQSQFNAHAAINADCEWEWDCYGNNWDSNGRERVG